MFTIHGFKDRKMSVCVKGLVFGVDCGIFAVVFLPQRTRRMAQRTQLCVLCVLLRVLCGEKKHNGVVAAEVSDTTMSIKDKMPITKL